MSNVLLTIATALDDLSTVTMTPEALFGRHCAILGSSGGGKSWSLARIIEQASNYRAKILLFDCSGEFERLGQGVFHVHVGSPTREVGNSKPVTVPYFELSENDLMAIFEPTSATQWVKLRAAIKTLKLLQMAPTLGTAGNFLKAHKHKVTFEDLLNTHAQHIERPDSIFNIFKLPLQIELECVEPNRSAAESDFWGGASAPEQSECIPLINRMEDILKAPEMRCIFNPPSGPSAFEALEKFLTDKTVSVLRISLEFLPATHRVREMVADSLARHMLYMARAGSLRDRPLVIALDEAHQVLRTSSSQQEAAHAPSAFEIIAKEGRKYGLTACLATQRPGDIPEAVLGQVGTLIVHRLVGASDLKAVERASGGVDQATLASLPILGPGEAFILGAGVRGAKKVKMLAPVHPPLSNGPDYQRAWRKEEKTTS